MTPLKKVRRLLKTPITQLLVFFFLLSKTIDNAVTLENLTKIVYTFVSLYTNKRGGTWDILIIQESQEAISLLSI